MIFECNNKKYEFTRGSDVTADGMYLEATDMQEPAQVLLFAFWSNANGSFTFSAYKHDLPFDLVEAFIQAARERLPERALEQP